MCRKQLGIENKLKESVSFVRWAYYMFVSLIACLGAKRISNPTKCYYKFRLARLQILADGAESSKACWRSCWKPSRLPQMTLLVRWGWLPRMGIAWAAGLNSCQESSPFPPQKEVIMDWQTHAEQLFTVPLLCLRFQRLEVHTICYCSSCFLPSRGRNSHVCARVLIG